MRGVAALTLDRKYPERIVNKSWPDEPGTRDIIQVIKAAQAPTNTGQFPQISALRIFPQLPGQSASGALLSMAQKVDLTGIYSVSIPYIGLAGRPAIPFVGEGLPFPIANMITSALVCGPVKKALIGVALSMELMEASGQTAADIISAALTVAAQQAFDAVLFSSNAATSAAPAGILHNISATPSAGTKGAAGVADDIALLASNIAGAGINVENMVIIAEPGLAYKIKVLASPKLTNVVLSSSSIPAGEVIAIVPEGLVTAYDGAVAIEIANAPVLHYEDTVPQDISTAGTPAVVAYPSKSAFQTDILAIKLRAQMAIAVHPGSVAYVTGAAW